MFQSCQTDSTGKYRVCMCNANLPTFEFTSKGIQFNITPAMYLQRTYGGRCYVLFEGLENLPFMILGDVFMQNYLTIFDKETNSVGIQGYKLRITQQYPPDRYAIRQFGIFTRKRNSFDSYSNDNVCVYQLAHDQDCEGGLKAGLGSARGLQCGVGQPRKLLKYATMIIIVWV